MRQAHCYLTNHSGILLQVYHSFRSMFGLDHTAIILATINTDFNSSRGLRYSPNSNNSYIKIRQDRLPCLAVHGCQRFKCIYSAGLAPGLWRPEAQPGSSAGWGSGIAQGLGCQAKASGSRVTPHNSMINIFTQDLC